MRSTQLTAPARHTRPGTSGSRPTRRRTWLRWGGVLASVGVVGAATGIAPAEAVTGYHVVVGSLGLSAHSGPGTGYGVVGKLVNGQAIDIACQTKGTLVGTGLPGTPTDVWDQLTNGWFITDYYTSTTGLGGAYTPGIPQCGVVPAPGPAPVPGPAPAPIYNRTKAAAWAIHNYDLNPNNSPFFLPNDKFSPLSKNSDCTNFVSQALYAGGIKRTGEWTDRSPKNSIASWPGGGTTAEVKADAFKNYVVNNGIATIKEISWSDNTAGGAQYGDIIGYDWNKGADGILDHLAIVTGFANNARTNPNISQHSPQRLDRYWSWDPEARKGAGDWIQNTHKGSRVYLIHIIK